MRKIFGLLLSLVVVFSMSVQTFATTVNDVMAELNNGVTIGNQVRQVPSEYIKLAEDFFNSNNFTDEELTFALSELREAEAIWAATGEPSFSKLPASVQQQLIDKAVSAASKVGATLTFDGKTIKVVDRNGKVYSTVYGGNPIKATGFDINTNGMVVVFAIVVAGLATSVIFAKKNRLFGAK